MSRLFDILAEQRIRDAIERGDLDNLPGAGRPLAFDDDPLLSPEQRMINRILKNAGFTPREVILRKEIAELRGQLDSLPEGPQRDALKRELAMLLLRLGEGS